MRIVKRKTKIFYFDAQDDFNGQVEICLIENRYTWRTDQTIRSLIPNLLYL